MTDNLRVINASASPDPLYVFVTPNPAWEIADGVVSLASAIIPVGEIAALATDAIKAMKAAETTGESTGFLADMGKAIDDAMTWLGGTWVGTGTTAVYQAVEKVITRIADIYEKISVLMTVKSALVGAKDVVGGKAEIEAAEKRVDAILASFDKFFADQAFKVLPLQMQGWDEISKNPLDYLSPSGWAALANADTAHLTVYRKGKYLASFNAHAQSAYVCTDELIWRIDDDDWANKVETIHGVTPLVATKVRRDVECYYKQAVELTGDEKTGWQPQELFRIPVKPEYRVLPMNLRIDVVWNDQGEGNQKGQLYIALLRDGNPVPGPNGDVVLGTGPAPHTSGQGAIVWQPGSELDKLIKPGDEFAVRAIVGAGGGHKLTLTSLLVTIPTSTLIYQGPPFEQAIKPDVPPIRNPYYSFPLVTHPHEGIPGRANWTCRIKGAEVVVNWDAPTLLNSYELEKVLKGEELETHFTEEALYQNDSLRTVIEVWKGGVKTTEKNLWENAPDPEGLSGPDLWKVDIPDEVLRASELPKDSPDKTPIEWAVSLWYLEDNIWPIFKRDTHLKINTFEIFVQYQW